MEGQTKFTRRNLYELVWSLPQKEAAETLGINKWDLPYFCEKHNVPRPESGYWTKRRLGRAVSKPDLPPGDDDDAIIREVRPKEADILAPDFLARADVLLAKENDPGMTVDVAGALTSPHPIVAELQRRLGKVKPDYTGALELSGTFGLRVTPGQVDRALLLLETLARACAKRGYLVGPKRNARLEVLDVRVWLQVREKLRQTDNPKFRKNAWGHPDGYRHLFAPTGTLTLTVGALHMTDAPGRPLESRTGEAMALLVRAAVDSCRHSLQLEARQRQWEMKREERQRRELEVAEKRRRLKELKDEEGRRVDGLHLQVDGWVRSGQIRVYVAAVKALLIDRDGKVVEGGEADKWLKWALEQADRADPLSPSPYSVLDEPEPGM